MRWLIGTLLLGIAASAVAQPPRDIRRAGPSGTARIIGTILLADAQQPKPLRRARVMLTGGDLPVGRTVITNDDGTFAFDGLPAGRYGVSAAKDAYAPMVYGAKRSGRPGASIPVRDGETRNITIRLPRGAVISGVITGADNQPAPGITVYAMSYRFNPGGGERWLTPAGQAARTDDRGVYRIFGLPPGEYVVGAETRSLVGPGDLQVISETEVRRALAALRETGITRTRPGIIAAPSALPPAEPRRTLAFAPVYFPGTAVSERATPVTVGAAEERYAIDFQLEYVPTARVSGTISEQGLVWMYPSGPQAFEQMKTASADVNGNFTFSAVPPGRYTVMARQYSQPRMIASATSGPPPIARSATTEIVVDGDDVAGVALGLQPGLTISGHVKFEGERRRPLEIPGLQFPVPAMLDISGSGRVPLPPVQLDGDGRFSITGVIPGAYRMSAFVPGVRTAYGGWWLTSMVIDEREALDRPLELRQSTADAVITLSDAASELKGRVTDGRGDGAPDWFVVVFSTDRNAWFFNSRRVAGVKPDGQGRYTIRNLPPGDYFIAAYDDVEVGEWYDTSMLQKLEPGAMRITMGPLERKTFDIRVK